MLHFKQKPSTALAVTGEGFLPCSVTSAKYHWAIIYIFEKKKRKKSASPSIEPVFCGTLSSRTQCHPKYHFCH